MQQIAIEINRLRCRANHGVMEQERIVGNEFEVSVRLCSPTFAAAETDKLQSTINYAEIVDVIKSVMRTPSALLEHVCGRMRSALIDRFPDITAGTVRIEKLHPPIPSTLMQSAAVELTWD